MLWLLSLAYLVCRSALYDTGKKCKGRAMILLDLGCLELGIFGDFVSRFLTEQIRVDFVYWKTPRSPNNFKTLYGFSRAKISFNEVTVRSCLCDLFISLFFCSSKTGVLTSCYDIAALLITPFVSYLGAKRKKPKWCGIGLFLMAIGFLVFILPHLISGKYLASKFCCNWKCCFL